MRKATKWTTLGHRRTHASSLAFWRSCRHILRVCLGGLGALLLAGSLAQAATIRSGDILVVDTGFGSGKLFRVDPKTGDRTVISDFGNSSQGPVDHSFLSGVAIGAGRIFVAAATTGIYEVNPATGKRTLMSNFTNGAFHGDVFGSELDALGRLFVAWAKPQFGGAPRAIVSVNTLTSTRVVVSDLTNPAEGDSFNCCTAYFDDLALEHSGMIVASLTWFIPVGPLQDVGDLYRINPTTGHRSLLSDFSNPAQGATEVVPAIGIALEKSGQILVNSHGTSTATAPRDLLLRIDPNTGHRVVLSNFDNAAQGPQGRRLSGIAVEKSGSGAIIVGASNPANMAAEPTLLFRVSQQTGQRTVLSDSANSTQGPSFTWIFGIAVVP